MSTIVGIVRFIHSVRSYFLGIGLVISLLGCFFPLFTSCFESEIGFVQSTVNGYESFSYMLAIFFLAVLILLVKILHTKAGTTVLMVSLVFIGIVQFYTKIGTAGFGRPCGKNPTIYLQYAHVGNILVVLWAILTSMWNQLSPKVKKPSSLLDDDMIEH